MAKFFFDTRAGDFIRDEEGLDCGGLDAVRSHAMAGLADLAKDKIKAAESEPLAVEVRDEHDRPVMQAVLRLEITPPANNQDR